jgi:hypothetical protein
MPVYAKRKGNILMKYEGLIVVTDDYFRLGCDDIWLGR